jgi:ankyrin repeat protein
MNILKDYADVELLEKSEDGKSKTENDSDSPDKSKEPDEIQHATKGESSVKESEEAPSGAPVPSKTPPLRDTAMIKALETGNLSFVRALLRMGVDPNEPIDENQRTALAVGSEREILFLS